MGFRRKKPDVKARREWDEFVSRSIALIQEIGLPSAIMQTEEHWQDFLYNGQLEIDDDPTEFTHPNVQAPSYSALVRLIESYFEMRNQSFDLWPAMLLFDDQQRLMKIFSEKI